LASGLALLAAAVLVVGLLYLRLASSVATGGYDVLKLENERSRLQIANQQLTYRVTELSSLARVEREARETLEMAPAEEILYLRARGR
jgi:cell division protein FtsL